MYLVKICDVALNASSEALSLKPQSLKKTIELLKNQQFFNFFLETEKRCFEDEIQVYVKEVTKEVTPQALSLKALYRILCCEFQCNIRFSRTFPPRGGPVE